jgi:hypothetical protein
LRRKSKVEKEENKIKGIFTFLEQVKEGVYTPVEVNTLSDARIEEEAEFCEEIYYYGIS